MLFALPHWLHAACVATIRIYGVLAPLHLVLEHLYALLHQWRLSVRKKHAKAAREQALTRPRERAQGVVKAHRRPGYAWLLPGYEKHIREQWQAVQRMELSHEPQSMAVYVTVYQEDPDLLVQCLDSLDQQDYRGKFHVFVVDDASYLAQLEKYSQPQPARLSFWRRLAAVLRRRKPVKFLWRKPENYAERLAHYRLLRHNLDAALDQFNWRPRFTVVRLKKNGGKREAQEQAWVRSTYWAGDLSEDGRRIMRRYDLYGSVDSDTVVAPNAFSLLAENFANPDVAAATGYVGVRNARKNLLTRLIDMRYWSAFHVERAAQSYHMAVMCCSGPLALYRAAVVDQVMGRYVTQRFRDRFCTFGDDRHLTNWILLRGYLVVMDPRATCLTQAPTTLVGYVRQQTRWNKSFYREMLWTTGAIRTHSWYMTYDLANQLVLPFLLVLSLFATLALTIGSGAWLAAVVQYVLTVVGIGFVRSLYGAIRRKQWSFLLFSLYGFMYVTVLLPVRFYALWTLSRTHWGTRTA